MVTTNVSLRDGKMPNTSSNNFKSGKFKVAVRNFGPIESANVHLKPLTVFVGKSNTGKTYLSTLIYALHQELGGFPQLPYALTPNIESVLKTLQNQNESFQNSLIKFKRKFIDNSQTPNFSDLPPIFNDMLFINGTQRENIQKKLINSILLSFGEKNIYSLSRNSRKLNTISIEFGHSSQDYDIWRAKIKGNKLKASFQASLLRDIPLPSVAIERIDELLGQLDFDMQSPIILSKKAQAIMTILSYPGSRIGSHVHYLPAVRGGIVQSHRFVASAGLDRLMASGLEDSQVVPSLPKTSIDFIKKLLSISTSASKFNQLPENHDESSHDCISSVADKFEELVLDGRVESHAEYTGGYPEIYFKPTKTDSKLTLNRSSSMVSELAPLVLFIRNFVRHSDLLILEEPEAHLHPGAQVNIAQCLALLVRKGVYVIVTTHSDWFLKCIQKLIIQGELKQLNVDNKGDEAGSYLHRNEVGAWNFTEGANCRGTKVKEIEFQEDSGIEPEDFEHLAFSLYNAVIGGRNLIVSREFSEGSSAEKIHDSDIELKETFTPSDIATQLSVNVERIRRKLKRFGVKPIKGQRYFFDKQEFDSLCERIMDEIGLNGSTQ